MSFPPTGEIVMTSNAYIMILAINNSRRAAGDRRPEPSVSWLANYQRSGIRNGNKKEGGDGACARLSARLRARVC